MGPRGGTSNRYTKIRSPANVAGGGSREWERGRRGDGDQTGAEFENSMHAKPQDDPPKPQLVGKLATECAVPRYRGPGSFNHSSVKRAVDVHVLGSQR